MRGFRLAIAAALALLLLPAPPARAETAPEAALPRVIRLIVPFSPGGSNDVVARLVAEAVTRRGAATIVVENRAGAAGLIGSEACSRAAPDGGTLCIANANLRNALVDAQAQRGPVAGLLPVVMLGTQPFVVAVNPRVPARSPAELVAWLRDNPGQAYGTIGNGSSSHYLGLLLERRAGAEFVHVAYRSGDAASLAAAQGEIAVAINQLVAVLGHARAGRLIPIATSGRGPSALLPGLPVLAELLGPEAVLVNANGLLAPARTPPELVLRLHAMVAAAMDEPGLRQRLAELGIEIELRGPAAFAEVLEEEEARLRAAWRR